MLKFTLSAISKELNTVQSTTTIEAESRKNALVIARDLKSRFFPNMKFSLKRQSQAEALKIQSDFLAMENN